MLGAIGIPLPYMRHLGIDFGTKKVGIALSDEGGNMGFPHSIIPNDSKLFETLTSLIKEEGVEVVVMGESLNFSGEENPVAKEAKTFAQKLASTGVNVVFEPEMLTTQEARRDFEGARTHGDVDSSAAALILTSYLGRHGNN